MRPILTITGTLLQNKVHIHVFDSELWRQHPLERIVLKDDDSPILSICSAIVHLPDDTFGIAIIEPASDRPVQVNWERDFPGARLIECPVTIVHTAAEYWAATMFTKTNRSIIEEETIAETEANRRARKEIHFCYKPSDGNSWSEIIHCIKRIGEPLEYRFNQRYESNIEQFNRLVRSFL